MNDTSRALRYALGTLCERYNSLIANKDTLDFRLGSNEPYGETAPGVDAEQAYADESHQVSTDLRALIVDMVEIAQRIRAIEGF
jgi:hypothetical protein